MESTKLPSNPTAATPGVSATSTPSPLPPTTITTPQLAPPGTGPTTADLPADIKARLNQIQQELLVKILLETKLNINYGIMLCEQSNWDYQQASVNFKTRLLLCLVMHLYNRIIIKREVE